MGETKRNSKGQFTKGHKGGPGRPSLQKYATFREKLIAAVTDNDLQKVVEQLKLAAFRGEPWAVKDLLDRLCGKPRVQVDVDLQAAVTGVLLTTGTLPEKDWRDLAMSRDQARNGKTIDVESKPLNGNGNGTANGSSKSGGSA